MCYYGMIYIAFVMSCVLDIHECGSNPCHNQGTCRDDINGYSCSCIEGYTGSNCVTGIVKPINVALRRANKSNTP